MPNLFAYGMLMSDSVTKRVTGRTYPKKSAQLDDYEVRMPGTGYSYILPRSGSVVDGYILYGIEDDVLAKIDRYESEGDLYDRRRVEVIVQGRREEAFTYVGNPNGLEKFFGPDVHNDVRIREYLERKLKDLTDLESADDTDTMRSAWAELLGDRMESLTLAHFRKEVGLSYVIGRVLSKKQEFPDLEWISSEPGAIPYADNYVRLMVKHVIFNQVEKRVRFCFAGELEVDSAYYDRTLSSLVSLVLLNRRSIAVDRLMEAMGIDRLDRRKSYLDYTILGIKIADMIFDRLEVKNIVDWVLSRRHPGRLPLGVEVEMSDIGAGAVTANPGDDPRFDSFYYFNDFDMLHRCWKLGGHVDDHSGIERTTGRTRGFFEYSLGKLSLAEDVSKPVTDDPWVVNQLINQSVLFAGISPHSFHVTLDLPENPDMSRSSDPELLICLLLMCGDICLNREGVLCEKRINESEVIDIHGRLHFSDENMHFASEQDKQDVLDREIEKKRLIEYKFMRLKNNRNYEPFIVALKGFQIGYNPRPLGSTFRPIDEYDFPEIGELMKWAANPKPLNDSTLAEFIRLVRIGLMSENESSPAHPIDYIEYMIGKIDRQLRRSNEFVRNNGRN